MELSGQSAKDAGLNSFWLYFNPNAITTENIPVVLALKDTMPLPGEKAYCYLPMDNFPRGISAGAAFSDMVAQQVFLTAEIVSTGGVLRAGRFATGAAIDLGLQLAMLDIIKTSLGERFTTTDLLAEVSWPSVLYSGLTYNKKIPVVVNILGSFTVGFADALAKEAFKEKSAKNLNLVQASYEGFRQALITAGVEAVLRLVKIPARYSRKQFEEAFEDAGKGVQGAGDVLGSIVKNGNKIEYTNPAGKLLKWSEQGANDVTNSINAAKNSTDAGRKLEGTVADFIKQEGKTVEGFGLTIRKADNSVATDIDILTKNEIIEVKNSYGAWSGKQEQVNRFVNSLLDDFVNPYNRKAILYIETPLTEIQRTTIINTIPNNVKLVNSLAELKTILK